MHYKNIDVYINAFVMYTPIYIFIYSYMYEGIKTLMYNVFIMYIFI